MNGNPTNVVENGVTLSLGYDRENRLTKVASASVGVTNVYDAFNRLIERQVGTNKVRFVYDNQWRVIAEYYPDESVAAKYVYGPEIDEPVKVTIGVAKRYFHQAALGTVTEITGRLGNINESYIYDVYGAVTIKDASGNVLTNSAIGNRFMFQGRDRDPDTGLYNFRYRYYSPTLGRFLQVDLIRQVAGVNMYKFLNNRPVNSIDPFGLSPNPAELAAELKELERQIEIYQRHVNNLPRYACDSTASQMRGILDQLLQRRAAILVSLGTAVPTLAATTAGVFSAAKLTGAGGALTGFGATGAAVAGGAMVATAAAGAAVGYGISQIPVGNGQNVSDVMGGWLYNICPRCF